MEILHDQENILDKIVNSLLEEKEEYGETENVKLFLELFQKQLQEIRTGSKIITQTNDFIENLKKE